MDKSMINANSKIEKKKSNAVCTIVSKNYLAYAKVLANSVKVSNPDLDFYLLIVDRKDSELKVEGINIVWVEDLDIEDFEKVAFKYNILELNTNVKPTFLLELLKNHDKVVYLDPDIFVFSSLHQIYDELEDYSITLTPHILNLNPKYSVDEELHLLSSGCYNLGFVGVNNSSQSIEFLKWWEVRCLHSAYDEIENGMFVDQKWINLIHSGFDSVKILRNCGMNVAYWNYHERSLSLSLTNDAVYVNEKTPLVFFHFSGLTDSTEVLSKYKPGLRIKDSDVIYGMLANYKEMLEKMQHSTMKKLPYTFGTFSNGDEINSFTRRIYASLNESFSKNPFDGNGEFYKFSQAKNLISKKNNKNSSSLNSKNYKQSKQFKIIIKLFKLAFSVLGVQRYDVLMKFLRKSTTIRNQAWLFDR